MGLDAAPSAAQEAELRQHVEELIGGARGWMKRTRGRVEAWRVEVTADLHYPKQAFDLTVTEPDAAGAAPLAAGLLARFHAAHHALYDFSEPSSPAEINRLVVSVVGALPKAKLRMEAAGAPGPVVRRRVRLNNETVDYRVLRRTDPALNAPLCEPLIIEQADTTTVVPPGWATRRTPSGSLHITRVGGEGHAR
jgi:N-methylhydantoinase A